MRVTVFILYTLIIFQIVRENFILFFSQQIQKKKANKGKTGKKIPHDMTPLNEHEFALRDVFMTSVA